MRSIQILLLSILGFSFAEVTAQQVTYDITPAQMSNPDCLNNCPCNQPEASIGYDGSTFTINWTSTGTTQALEVTLRFYELHHDATLLSGNPTNVSLNSVFDQTYSSTNTNCDPVIAEIDLDPANYIVAGQNEISFDYQAASGASVEWNSHPDWAQNVLARISVQYECESEAIDTRTACDSLVWEDGNTYYSSINGPFVTYNGAGVGGCDSILRLDLTVLESASGLANHSECGFFTWLDGVTYTEDIIGPTYTIEGGAANGCDSTVTLQLEVTDSIIGLDERTECASFTWIDGNLYSESNNSAYHIIEDGASNGCDSIVFLRLEFDQPVVGVDSRAVCDSLVWIDGETYYQDTNSPTYTYVGGSASGCDSVVALSLVVTSVNTEVTQNGLFLTTSSPGASYQWLDCNNSYSIIPGANFHGYEIQSPGSYAVELTNGGCVDTSDCVVITVVGADLETFADQVGVYPNPTSGLFSISIPKDEMVDVRIESIDGRMLYQQTVNSVGNLNLSLENEPAGVYILSVEGASGKSSIRLLKKE